MISEDSTYWNFVKDSTMIWCINLPERSDKRAHVLNEFRKIGILNQVHFYSPEKYEGNVPQKGCWDSHIYCMRAALNEGKHLILFEDDVVFVDNWIEYYDMMRDNYMAYDWDILRLGSFVFQYDYEVRPYVWSGEFNATHAICLHNDYIERCLNDPLFCAEKYPYPGVDEYHRNECLSDYALVPCIAYQQYFSTDNTWHSSFNVWQIAFQNKYLYMYHQYLMNGISWRLRTFPILSQLNPYVLAFNVSDYLFNAYGTAKKFLSSLQLYYK